MLFENGLPAALTDPALDTMNFLNEIRERYPQAISLAAGRPFEGFFRVAPALRQIETFTKDLDALVQYGATNGLIRQDLARLLANDEKIVADPSSFLVTLGAQEAMWIAVAGLCRPESDVILVADPSYVGITGCAKLQGIELCAVRTDEQGMDLADLRTQVASIRQRGKRPRLVYDIPDFSNPSGYRMPLAARRELLALAEQEDILILEDSVYRTFDYDEGEAPPALKALDNKQRVIYIGTFAKSIFPGARMGFLLADQTVHDERGNARPLTEYFSKIKSLLSLNTPPITQALVGALLREQNHSLREYTRPARDYYRGNRDALLAALTRAFPSSEGWTRGVHWNRPAGGFFLVLTVPWNVDEKALQVCAGDYGVIWAPMRIFHLGPNGDKQLRLSFSYNSREEIDEGVKRLARFVREWPQRSEATLA